MALEEIFADVKQEGDTNPFAPLEKETPTESQPETKPEGTVEEKKPEGGGNTPPENTPFHEHPRWKQREEELRTLREENARILAEFETIKKTPKSSNVPDWFGGDEVAWQKYLDHESVKAKEIEDRVLARQDEERNKQKAEAEKWDHWVTDEVTKLQTKGLKFERNELLQVMLDYKPSDENGLLDFQKGYQILEALKFKDVDPARSKARKEIADITSRSKGSEKPTKDYLTPADLRNKSWNQL